uniref:Uncharacterized protein n=1 Tax=Rhizophora mucronata TaxID=61149 RepID=A0A2P2L9H7_RHIMU
MNKHLSLVMSKKMDITHLGGFMVKITESYY